MLLAISMISVSPISAAEFSDGGGIVVDNAEEGDSAEKDLSTATSENEDSADSSAEIDNSSLFSDTTDSGNLVDSFDSLDSAAAAENPVFSDQLIPDVNDYSNLQAAGSVRDDTVSSSNTYNITVEGTLIRSEAAEFVRLVNEARAERGLNPVTLDQDVQNISEQRAIHLAAMYSHDSPDGDGAFKYWYAECIVASSSIISNTAEDFFNIWKNSSAHWDILMSSKYKSIGYAEFKTSTGAIYAATNLYRGDVKDPIIYDQKDESGDFSFNITKEYMYNNYKKSTYNLPCNSICKVDLKLNNVRSSSTCTFTSVNGKWESSSPHVATVDNEGNVTALSPGTTIIRYYINGIRDHSFDTVINVTSIKTPVIKAHVSKSLPMVNLKWNLTEDILDNANSMGYQIFVYDQASGKYHMFRDICLDREDFDGEYFTSFLSDYGTTKKVKVRLYEVQDNGEKGYGDYSNTITVSTAPEYSEMKSVTIKNRKAYLRWTKSEKADGYVIYRRVGKSGKYKKIKTIKSGNTVKYTNSKLSYGKKYYYKIRAFYVNPSGKKIYTAYSNVKGKTCK